MTPITLISDFVEGLFKALALISLVFVLTPLGHHFGFEVRDFAAPVIVILAVCGLSRRWLGQRAFIAEMTKSLPRARKRQVR